MERNRNQRQEKGITKKRTKDSARRQRLYKRWARDNEVNQKMSEGVNLASWAERAQDIPEILRLPVRRGWAMEERAGKGGDERRAAWQMWEPLFEQEGQTGMSPPA